MFFITSHGSRVNVLEILDEISERNVVYNILQTRGHNAWTRSSTKSLLRNSPHNNFRIAHSNINFLISQNVGSETLIQMNY